MRGLFGSDLNFCAQVGVVGAGSEDLAVWQPAQMAKAAMTTTTSKEIRFGYMTICNI